MNIKSSLVLLFSFLVTGHAFAIDPVYEGPDGIRAQVFATNCLACHSSEKVGADRNGAPPTVNWDTYEAARPNAEIAIVRAVEEESMPPTGSGIPKLNDEQKAAMLAWQDAGFPQEAAATSADATFDLTGNTLKLPVVIVGSQKFNATLRLIPLESSPTGYGFVLENAEQTTASSDAPATYTPETGKVLIPSVDVIQNGTVQDQATNVELTLVAGSDPMTFSLDESGLEIPTTAFFSYEASKLALPVVNVGEQKFSAVLKLIQLPSSPTGLGFELEGAELTTLTSDAPATYDPESGSLTLPLIDLQRNGVSEDQVSAEMQLITGSDPLQFSLTSYAPIAQ
jgi:cytochrome c5